MPDFLPAGGAPSSIAWSVTGLLIVDEGAWLAAAVRPVPAPKTPRRTLSITRTPRSEGVRRPRLELGTRWLRVACSVLGLERRLCWSAAAHSAFDHD